MTPACSAHFAPRSGKISNNDPNWPSLAKTWIPATEISPTSAFRRNSTFSAGVLSRTAPGKATICRRRWESGDASATASSRRGSAACCCGVLRTWRPCQNHHPKPTAANTNSTMTAHFLIADRRFLMMTSRRAASRPPANEGQHSCLAKGLYHALHFCFPPLRTGCGTNLLSCSPIRRHGRNRDESGLLICAGPSL